MSTCERGRIDVAGWTTSFTIPAKFRSSERGFSSQPRNRKTRGAIREVGNGHALRISRISVLFGSVISGEREEALALLPREFIRNFVARVAGRRFYEAVNLLGTKGVGRGYG